jgi:hypothetical protein
VPFHTLPPSSWTAALDDDGAPAETKQQRAQVPLRLLLLRLVRRLTAMATGTTATTAAVAAMPPAPASSLEEPVRDRSCPGIRARRRTSP